MNQSFLGVFLAFIGLIGLIVGLVQGHLTESPTQTLMYVLPLLIGVIMVVIDQTGGRKK